MKDMDERLEEELKKRLREYSEEPREELWNKVAQGIPTSNESKWVSQAGRVSDISTGLVVLLLFLAHTPFEETILWTGHLKSALLERDNTPEAAPVPILTDDAASVREVNGGSSVSSQAITPDGTQKQFVVKANQIAKTTEKERVFETNIIKETIFAIEAEMVPVTEVSEEIILTIQQDPSSLIDPAGESKQESTSPERPTLTEDEKMAEQKASEVKQKQDARSRSERKYNKGNFYLTAMPTFGYQRIESNTNDNLIVESIKKIPSFSTDRLGIRAELGLEVPISQRIKIFGGLLYYQRKQTIGYTEMLVDTIMIMPDPDGGVIIETEFSYVNKSFEYELKNFGLQMGLNYRLSKKKFLQTLGTGLEIQVALNKLNDADKPEGFTSNPSAYVFYNLYYRLQYPAEGRLKAVFQPTLNYSFYINQDLNAPFYVKPYGLGLNIGCTYNF